MKRACTISLLRIYAPRALLFSVLAAGLAAPALAEQLQVKLDPAQTKITIAVHDVHGGVHGTFKLVSGLVTFDRETGKAGGEIMVDARSGDTGNSSRDKKMHQDVLESARYPEITFTPKRVIGEVAAQGQCNIQVEGVFRIHGTDHDLTLSVPLQVSGDKVTAKTTFAVPYQAWGMKNPSVLFLRVDGSAEVSVSAVASITVAKASNSH